MSQDYDDYEDEGRRQRDDDRLEDGDDHRASRRAKDRTNVPGILLIVLGVLNLLGSGYFLFNGLVALTPAGKAAAAKQAEAMNPQQKQQMQQMGWNYDSLIGTVGKGYIAIGALGILLAIGTIIAGVRIGATPRLYPGGHHVDCRLHPLPFAGGLLSPRPGVRHLVAGGAAELGRKVRLPLSNRSHRGYLPAQSWGRWRLRRPCEAASGPLSERSMTQQLITVGHSPDPDDAFMFYALAHDKIDTGNLRFRHELQDIETLNRRAMRGELEVSAVSIHAYAHLLDKYALLPSGCSMGDRYGPMVVARQPLTVEQLKSVRIAVPGTLTTAFLTLRLLLPGGFQYEVMPFDQIITAVAEGSFEAGLIIHEGQLTFQNQGLQLVVDLGVWWQEKTGLPLPLGGNVVRRDLGAETMRQISRLLKESIRYSLEHRDAALDYALQYARDMDKNLADRFVGMYVNDWTLDYGPRGREAVRRLLEEGHKAGVIPSAVNVEFVD